MSLVPWKALRGLAPALDSTLAEILSGAAADGALVAFLRAHPALSSAARTAAAEAVLGVALWRRRLRAQLDACDAPPRLLLGALLRDLGGRDDAEELADLPPGAGGKTLLLAAAVGAAGRVHAADPDAERLVRLRARAARAGVLDVVAVHGAAAPDDLLVDRALVDAPCSELGALRRGPDLRWRLDPAAFATLPTVQRGILERALRHVRRGGMLVYATCTFRREEDEEVALALEDAHPELERIRPAVDASVVTGDGFLRAWPHRHGTDAFFAAAWTRRC